MHPQFSLEDMYADLVTRWDATKQAMGWQLCELVKVGSLARIANGIFTLSSKQKFLPKLSQQATKVGKSLQKQFPLMKFCIYESNHISPLQHHLSYTDTLYVETLRNAVEIVFHTLVGKYNRVLLSPNETEISRYLDPSKHNIVVKPLITEAPVQNKDFIKVPTIEKLLVDIYCDKDFYYMQGAEYEHIWNNAYSMYNINITTLLRYATRRGVKDEFSKLVQYDK